MNYLTIPLDSKHELIPESFRKKLPQSYLSIPTILLGHLAIDKKYQAQGIGKALLIDALKRCFDISNSIGAFTVIVNPLDNQAELFYKKYAFVKLPDSGKMFLPMKTIKELLI
ncbi:MAG: GNAT family N-acetyltransferase [Bacteroidota bacterium]|nr:GNAT family N-acetyltransferase [Bacteroidota bacterium]